MRYSVTSPETEHRLATISVDEQAWEVALADEKGGETKQLIKGAELTLRDGLLELRLESPAGMRVVFPVHRQGNDGVVVLSTALGSFRLLPARGSAHDAAAGARSGAKSIKSSMPGKVLKVLCKAGDLVEVGQPLLIIEAMKMENEIRSTAAGKIDEIGVQTGQSISTGDLLVKISSGEKK